MVTTAVLSDVHGVLGALDAVLAEPDVAAADHVVVTGDHVWGPQPAEVLDRLLDLGERAVLLRGNADRELLEAREGRGSVRDEVTVWGAAQVREDQADALRAMPERVTLDLPGFGPVLFCHATPRDDEEVVVVDSRPERWAEVFAGLAPDVGTVVCGHTHMPFVRLAAGRLVVNPGSVGLPYGPPGAHWALLADGAVTLRRTRYDVDALVAATVAASSMSGVRAFLDDQLRPPPSDVEALAAFGVRDGRQT